MGKRVNTAPLPHPPGPATAVVSLASGHVSLSLYTSHIFRCVISIFSDSRLPSLQI